MFWLDYTVESFPDGSFTVKGDWPKEVMGYDRDGNPNCKSHPLYSPGDVFVVDDEGILRKQEELTSLMLKYESKKNESSSP